MKIIAFGASYSRSSINKQFATYAAEQFKNEEVEVLDLNAFQLPLFTVDIEAELGHPQAAKDFVITLDSADLLIISLGEHNGSYEAAFKNLFDWASRVKLHLFNNKKILLLSTATGARGGKSVMEAAMSRFPRHGGEIIAQFSLPNFGQNFSKEKGITNDELKADFSNEIQKVKKRLERVEM